jgi:hypothetical protein
MLGEKPGRSDNFRFRNALKFIYVQIKITSPDPVKRGKGRWEEGMERERRGEEGKLLH